MSIDTAINPPNPVIQTPLMLPSDILIVDDRLENLRLLSQMLAMKGYSVRKATGGEMALNSIASLPPDLILLDILMPDLNGYEVCVQLKSCPFTAKIPIIFLSALNDPLDIGKAFEVGGADYLTKPFQVDEVLARVYSQLALKKAQEQVLELNAQLQEWVTDRESNPSTNQQPPLPEVDVQEPATPLPNRAAFLAKLEQSFFLARLDNSYRYAVLYLNCDHFKVVNHTYGYHIGDELLKQVGMRVQEVIPSSAMLATLGGDEFAILFQPLSNSNQAIHLVSRILATVGKPFQFEDHEIRITASIGIAMGQTHGDSSQQVLCQAEMAMYRAKPLENCQYALFTSQPE